MLFLRDDLPLLKHVCIVIFPIFPIFPIVLRALVYTANCPLYNVHLAVLIHTLHISC